MDSDIQATIDRIDHRVDKLLKIKQMLIDEFETELSQGVEKPRRRAVKKTFKKRVAHRKKPTRKVQLRRVLREHGPLTRSEIIERTGFPVGTVAFLLNDKDTFYRTQDGKWGLTGPQGGQYE